MALESSEPGRPGGWTRPCSAPTTTTQSPPPPPPPSPPPPPLSPPPQSPALPEGPPEPEPPEPESPLLDRRSFALRLRGQAAHAKTAKKTDRNTRLAICIARSTTGSTRRAYRRAAPRRRGTAVIQGSRRTASNGSGQQTAHRTFPQVGVAQSPARGSVARGGVEPPTFRFSVGRSYQLSYLAVHETGGPDGT